MVTQTSDLALSTHDAPVQPTSGAEQKRWLGIALAGVLGPLGFAHWAVWRNTPKARWQAVGLTVLWLAQAALAWWWLPPQLLQKKWYIALVPLTANGIAMAWLLAALLWPREPNESRGAYALGHLLHILGLEAWFIALNGLSSTPIPMTWLITCPLALGVLWGLPWQEMAPGLPLNERARKAHFRMWFGWFLALSTSTIAFMLFRLVAVLQKR